MDSRFLEFWGHFLLNAAAGQTQLEQMSHWMKSEFSGSREMAAMLGRFYGVEPAKELEPQSRELDCWQKTLAKFQSSLAEFGRQWGWVPEKEHLQLQKEHAALQHVWQNKKKSWQLCALF